MQSKMLRNCMVAASLLLSMAGATAGNPCNPCAPKAANPCAVKHKNPCNPCAGGNHIDPKLVTRPAGTKLAAGNAAELVKEGETLWSSKALSTNGMACATCHQNNGAFNASFAKPYPHAVEMVRERSGLKKVALDEMVQFCMLAPMAAKPLPWDSRELAALTAYAGQVQKHFKPTAANPGNANNPCAPKKNPCAPANPCAPRK